MDFYMGSSLYSYKMGETEQIRKDITVLGTQHGMNNSLDNAIHCGISHIENVLMRITNVTKFIHLIQVTP